MFILRKAILYTISPFARVANKINWRIGRPYKSCFDTIQPYMEKLAPGMIVLSHKDYELTNWFISGHWTHVSVIASEREIIEAVGQGVIKTPIRKFFSSVDDFMILEPTFCSRETMANAVKYMEKYIGYPYNFVFLQSEHAFTCIDLVYRAYSLSVKKADYNTLKLPGLFRYVSRDVIMPESLLNLEGAWQIVYKSLAETA
jgi:hypothetical protein